jgi:hypothetical protein
MNKFQENSQNQQNSPNNLPILTNPPVDQEPSLTSIFTGILTQLTPVLVSKLTGQKMMMNNPAPSNQDNLSQLTPILQNMINTQNLLLQEIILLKKNDQTIANNFQGLKLTHERKQIEYNPQQNSNDYHE